MICLGTVFRKRDGKRWELFGPTEEETGFNVLGVAKVSVIWYNIILYGSQNRKVILPELQRKRQQGE